MATSIAGYAKDILATNPMFKKRFSGRARGLRMKKFTEVMNLQGGERVLDLGGVPGFWDICPCALDLTIVNLPGAHRQTPSRSRHRVSFVEGDACDLHLPGEPNFDIVFTNSVIEHVGSRERRRRFAGQVRRRASRYWVQTPSIWFPVEAHTNMPFWWAYPAPLRRHFIQKWKKRFPEWTEMIEGTTVVSRRELEVLFPEGSLWVEGYSGFSKSYVVYKDA